MEQLLAQLAQFMDPDDRDLDSFALKQIIAMLEKARAAKLSFTVDISRIRVYLKATPETAEAARTLRQEMAVLDLFESLNP